eukprot:sb/3466829/
MFLDTAPSIGILNELCSCSDEVWATSGSARKDSITKRPTAEENTAKRLTTKAATTKRPTSKAATAGSTESSEDEAVKCRRDCEIPIKQERIEVDDTTTVGRLGTDDRKVSGGKKGTKNQENGKGKVQYKSGKGNVQKKSKKGNTQRRKYRNSRVSKPYQPRLKPYRNSKPYQQPQQPIKGYKQPIASARGYRKPVHHQYPVRHWPFFQFLPEPLQNLFSSEKRRSDYDEAVEDDDGFSGVSDFFGEEELSRGDTDIFGQLVMTAPPESENEGTENDDSESGCTCRMHVRECEDEFRTYTYESTSGSSCQDQCDLLTWLEKC